MKQIQKIFLVNLLILSSLLSRINAGKTTEQLNQLHQDIGKELISIRKDHNELQSRIYPLLDQVGTIHRLACNTIKKKKNLKISLQQERETFASIKNDNMRLKAEIDSLQNNLELQNNQLALHQQKLQELAQEHTEALKRNEELISAKENNILSQAQELESKKTELVANTIKPSNTTARNAKKA